MSFRLRHLLLIFLLSGATAASAQDSNQNDYYALILSYVDKVENIYNGNWAYSYIIVDRLEQETRTIRRDNSQPFLEREQLLAINGQPPSEESCRSIRKNASVPSSVVRNVVLRKKAQKSGQGSGRTG